jgi:hypothetical protein
VASCDSGLWKRTPLFAEEAITDLSENLYGNLRQNLFFQASFWPCNCFIDNNTLVELVDERYIGNHR